MGGLEKTSYDAKEKLLYGVSEQGFVSAMPLILFPFLFDPDISHVISFVA
jgi:hypothetical protein